MFLRIYTNFLSYITMRKQIEEKLRYKNSRIITPITFRVPVKFCHWLLQWWPKCHQFTLRSQNTKITKCRVMFPLSISHTYGSLRDHTSVRKTPSTPYLSRVLPTISYYFFLLKNWVTRYLNGLINGISIHGWRVHSMEWILPWIMGNYLDRWIIT